MERGLGYCLIYLLKRFSQDFNFFQLGFEELISNLFSHTADLNGFTFEVVHPSKVLFVERHVSCKYGVEGIVSD